MIGLSDVQIERRQVTAPDQPEADCPAAREDQATGRSECEESFWRTGISEAARQAASMTDAECQMADFGIRHSAFGICGPSSSFF
jgi:hypothetical protein